MKHISDEDLQLYASGKSGDRTGLIEEHLHSCEKCRQQLAVYKAIDIALENRGEVGFGHNFDMAVMNGIHGLEKKPNRTSDYAVIGFALAGMVGIFLFFFFSDYFRDLFSHGFNYFLESAKAYTSSSGEFNDWLKIAPGAVIVLLCYDLLDRLLARVRGIKSNYMFL